MLLFGEAIFFQHPRLCYFPDRIWAPAK